MPTKATLAERAEITTRVISDIENAKRDNYSQKTLLKLDRVLRWNDGDSHALLSKLVSPTPVSNDSQPGGIDRLGRLIAGRIRQLGFSTAREFSASCELPENMVSGMIAGTIFELDGPVAAQLESALRWERGDLGRVFLGYAPREMDDDPLGADGADSIYDAARTAAEKGASALDCFANAAGDEPLQYMRTKDRFLLACLLLQADIYEIGNLTEQESHLILKALQLTLQREIYRYEMESAARNARASGTLSDLNEDTSATTGVDDGGTVTRLPHPDSGTVETHPVTGETLIPPSQRGEYAEEKYAAYNPGYSIDDEREGTATNNT